MKQAISGWDATPGIPAVAVLYLASQQHLEVFQRRAE